MNTNNLTERGGTRSFVLAPILEDIAGWNRLRIRSFFESYGIMIQEWDRVRTDWLTLRAASIAESEAAASGK